MSVASLMNAVADHYTWRHTKSATGGDEKTLRLVKTGLLCRIEQVSEGSGVTIGSRRVQGTHLIIFASDPGLSQVDSSVVISGVRYEITGLENPAGMNRHWEVAAMRTGGLDGVSPQGL